MVLPEVSQFTSAWCLFAFGNGMSFIRIGGCRESEVYVNVCYLLLKFVTRFFSPLLPWPIIKLELHLCHS